MASSHRPTNSESESEANLLLGPPAINYSLYDRKKSIIITWSIILADSCILPIVLFYALWFTKLSHSTVFNILSSVFGLPSMLQWVKRMWYLCKKDSDCRPIGGDKLRVDTFQIGFTVNILLITAQVIYAVSKDPPVVPLFAMITETMLFLSGIQFVIHFFLYHAGVKTHFRVSSMPAGTPSPPGIFTLVEDIVAVDGGGGTRFREEWKARYEASPLFRRMLNRLDAFWGFGALLAATVLTVMLWTIPIVDVYWIGWSVPFMWAGLWAFLTIHYVRKCLVEERASWKSEAMHENGVPLIARATTLSSPPSVYNTPYDEYDG